MKFIIKPRLYVLERKNNIWRLRNKIKGFDISSRHLEFVKPNEILISHEQKGVYLLNVNVDGKVATKKIIIN